jgi:hypothetical protein
VILNRAMPSPGSPSPTAGSVVVAANPSRTNSAKCAIVKPCKHDCFGAARVAAANEQRKRAALMGLRHALAAPLMAWRRHGGLPMRGATVYARRYRAKTGRYFQREKVPAGGASGQKVRNRDGAD